MPPGHSYAMGTRIRGGKQMPRGVKITLIIVLALFVLALVAPRLYNELANTLVSFFQWLGSLAESTE